MSDQRRSTFSLFRQFFLEKGYQETLRTFERDAGLYFDRSYFKELVLNGQWDEAEKYLSAFLKIDGGNVYSVNIYFEFYKEKYVEALDRNDRSNAVEILRNDLRFLKGRHPEIYEELTSFLSWNDFRKHPLLTYYKDFTSGRIHTMDAIDKLIDKNPDLQHKLELQHLDPPQMANIIHNMLLHTRG